MAQKNATPTRTQQQYIKAAGLEHPKIWTVLQDLTYTMIIRHQISGEVKLIEKKRTASSGNDTGSGKENVHVYFKR